MAEYRVEFYKNDDSLEPYSTCFEDADTIEKAAINTAKYLEKVEFKVNYELAWRAKIIGPDKEDYEILKGGKWLINPKTGKKLSNLEEKV